MKVVTYATHNFGTFNDIVNNPWNVHVDVLGWGSKWNGFLDKVTGVYEYCKALPDEEIVIFIDGFDSEIMKSLDGLEDIFKSFNCGVLLSRDIFYNSEIMDKTVKKVFGSCQDGIIANSGLYMGTVWYLKIFLQAVLNEEYDDD